MCLLGVIFAVCDEIKGVVIGDPYIISLQIVIQSVDVRYVFIGKCLFTVSHQRNYCLRKLIGLPAKTTLGRYLIKILRIKLCDPLYHKLIAAGNRQSAFIKIEIQKSVKYMLRNIGVTFIPSATLIYKSFNVAVFKCGVLAIQYIGGYIYLGMFELHLSNKKQICIGFFAITLVPVHLPDLEYLDPVSRLLPFAFRVLFKRLCNSL